MPTTLKKVIKKEYTLYDYINIILKDKNKNMDKAYELEMLFFQFKDKM